MRTESSSHFKTSSATGKCILTRYQHASYILLAWQDNLKRWVQGNDTDNSQDTIWHNGRATNWIMCNLLPGRDRVMFSSPEHLVWLLWLFRPLFNGVQVQILQQALILTPTQSDRQLWMSKKVCEMAYVSWESAEYTRSYNRAQNFFSHLKISTRLMEKTYCAKHAFHFLLLLMFETCFTLQILKK
jgi:hypothetical protein